MQWTVAPFGIALYPIRTYRSMGTALENGAQPASKRQQWLIQDRPHRFLQIDVCLVEATRLSFPYR
eukprot:2717914-Pyramimonas_sp.AAC.1